MPAISTAFRAFFKSLFDSRAAQQIAAVLDDKPAITSSSQDDKTDDSDGQPKLDARSHASDETLVSTPRSKRNDAIALLELMQREARFVDFIMEEIDEYSDEQVGAAARDLHRGCHDLLQKTFAIRPVSDEEEGAEVEVAAGYSATRYRLIGNVSGKPPYQGELLHRGWEAESCSLPDWAGDKQSVNLVAPIEVEVK